MAGITVYGIPNCDVTRKLIRWLKVNNIEFSFHDYKISGISKTKLAEWCKRKGMEQLLNKRGTTWKNLPETKKESITDIPAAVNLMAANTSLIKRPVIEIDGKLLVGYNENEFLTNIKIKK